MSAFVIGRISIYDRDKYAVYEEGFMPILEQYGGKLLSVDEAPEALEGDWPATRSVILYFPDKKAAKAWYESEQYQLLAQHRLAASDGNVLLVEGLE